MDEKLFKQGKLVGYYTIPKELLNMICDSLQTQGHEIDWHYIGGWPESRHLSQRRKHNAKIQELNKEIQLNKG